MDMWASMKLWPTDLPLSCFCIIHAAFHLFHHYIGQYSFYLPFYTKKQVAFPDQLSELTFLPVNDREMDARVANGI